MSEPNVEYRAATAQDAARISAIVRSAYAKWVPLIGREPRPMFADYAEAAREHRIELMYVGDDIVGLVEMDLRNDHLWIENICVQPEEQGKGFGRRLLARAETHARDAGLSEMRLLTNEAFKANVLLYERYGYSVTAREPFMGGITVYMTKPLDR